MSFERIVKDLEQHYAMNSCMNSKINNGTVMNLSEMYLHKCELNLAIIWGSGCSTVGRVITYNIR